MEWVGCFGIEMARKTTHYTCNESLKEETQIAMKKFIVQLTISTSQLKYIARFKSTDLVLFEVEK